MHRRWFAPAQLSGSDLNSLSYNMSTELEEGLERSAVILAIYTVLDLMRADVAPVGLR
jgi:hypothetical protein